MQQYDDYLEHKDFKYLEKIKEGARTRYFYTKEALQGYYNNLKEKHKGIGAAEVKLGRVFGPKRKLTKEQKQQKKAFNKQEKTYRKEEQKNYKEGLKSVKKKQKADARSARITYIKNTPVRVKNAAKRAWNRIWQGSKAKAKLDSFTENYKKSKSDKLRKKLGLPTSQADINARKKKIERRRDTFIRTKKTRDSVNPNLNGSDERRKALGLPATRFEINARRNKLTDDIKTRKNRIARTKKTRDSVNPNKNGSKERRKALGLVTNQLDIINRRRNLQQRTLINKIAKVINPKEDPALKKKR